MAGDRGASEWLFTGTTSDGKKVEVNGCDLFTFRGGKIARKESYGWCDLRNARTWSIVLSSKSFGSLQGNTVDCAFGASAAMSTDV